MQDAPSINIRHAEPEDFESIRQILASRTSVWGTTQLPFPSAQQWRKRLVEPPAGLYNLVAIVENEVVGQLALSTFPNRPRRRHVGQLGMAVREDSHGRGVGTSLVEAATELADKWLNLIRLELEVYTDNEKAIRLYKKFGFQIEGTLAQFAFRDGSYVDAFVMGRIRS